MGRWPPSISFFILKPGLHNCECERCMWTRHERRGRMYGTFLHCLAFINVLYANSLWNTNSWLIAFGCSPNIRHTAKCCLPLLGNKSTLNDGFVFACCVRIHIPFAFRCKPSLRCPFFDNSIPISYPLAKYPAYFNFNFFITQPISLAPIFTIFVPRGILSLILI